MKNLLNLKGVHQLNKKEQQSINGGLDCSTDADCASVCGICVPGYGVCIFAIPVCG